ncbi:hypothetical protein C9374_014712 [Naegleria lovaniensis]|uniref:Uncharacterized protein n=1 Tax=Naegleria lovaniensis TaxID=51637 RepID=A0AA88GAX5_NAELO|nr:uncharacterized protein C9374_014712 [Naegleria lovaniensis]KAG2370649.1 hypothetical protein C9374_014712 [Naegleria lovaniensis]
MKRTLFEAEPPKKSNESPQSLSSSEQQDMQSMATKKMKFTNITLNHDEDDHPVMVTMIDHEMNFPNGHSIFELLKQKMRRKPLLQLDIVSSDEAVRTIASKDASRNNTILAYSNIKDMKAIHLLHYDHEQVLLVSDVENKRFLAFNSCFELKLEISTRPYAPVRFCIHNLDIRKEDKTNAESSDCKQFIIFTTDEKQQKLVKIPLRGPWPCDVPSWIQSMSSKAAELAISHRLNCLFVASSDYATIIMRDIHKGIQFRSIDLLTINLDPP